MEKIPQNGQPNLTPQLKKQTESTILTLNEDDQKIAFAHFEKKIREFQNADYQNLHKLLLKWGKFIGLKEAPTPKEMFMLVVFVKENFIDVSLQEITNAFNMACAGKLDINVEHYNSFSPIYISKILNAYKENKRLVMHRLYEAEQNAINQEKEKPLTPEQLDQKNTENALVVFQRYQEDGRIPDYGFMIYDFLVSKKLIKFNKEEKTEILKRAKEMSLSDGQRHLQKRIQPELKSQIQETLDKIANHDKEKSDVVLKYCKNIGLSKYFDSLISDPNKMREVLKTLGVELETHSIKDKEGNDKSRIK